MTDNDFQQFKPHGFAAALDALHNQPRHWLDGTPNPSRHSDRDRLDVRDPRHAITYRLTVTTWRPRGYRHCRWSVLVHVRDADAHNAFRLYDRHVGTCANAGDSRRAAVHAGLSTAAYYSTSTRPAGP